MICILNYIFKKKNIKNNRNNEFRSELVRLSHKVKSTTSKAQIIKICNKYFKIKELGWLII